MTEETNADLSLTERMELIASSLNKVGFSGSVDVIREGVKEIEELKETLDAIAEDAEAPQRFYDRNGPTWTSPAGNEYEDTSDHLDFANRIAELARKAINGESSTLRAELKAMADKVAAVAERNRKLEQALERLGSMEPFTVSFSVPNNAVGQELNKRISFARETLKGDGCDD